MNSMNRKIYVTSLRPEIFGDINFILSWPGFVGKSCNKLTNAPAGINDRALIDSKQLLPFREAKCFPSPGGYLKFFHKHTQK